MNGKSYPSDRKDEEWELLQPLLPEAKPGGRPRSVDLREVLNAIFFVLRTGCQWSALNATGLCPKSTAHDRFQQWAAAGVFLKLGQAGVAQFDELKGIEWDWLSMDGAMTKAPLGGEKNRSQSDRPGQNGQQTQFVDRGTRRAAGTGR